MIQFNRRHFLKAAGASAAACLTTPILESQVFATGGQFPTRLIVFFSANGTLPDRWRPQGTTGHHSKWSFKKGDILEALTPYKEDLILLEGVDMKSARSGPGDGHQTGMGHMLTGTELLPGDTKGGCDNCPSAGWAGGPSVDQFIAQRIHNGELFRSLEFGVQCGNPNNWSRMCYAGPDKPVAPREDPYSTFNAIAGRVGLDRENLARIEARRASVLDFVGQDLSKLKTQVSARDLQRIDDHLTTIRDIEKQLRTGDDAGLSCMLPEKGSVIDPFKEANFPVVGKLMMDLIATSIQCGLTRVASMQWSRSVSQVNHTWAGVNFRHHSLSHLDGEDRGKELDALVKINRWYAEQFAYLVGKLKSMPEGNGSVLDNTVLVWCNELGEGKSHTRNDMPYVIAGGGGGFFKTGQYHFLDDKAHNDLLVSLCQMMGVNVNTFGNPKFCTGALTELHA